MHSPEIENLIHCLSKLPGLGPRSGRRAALHLLKKKDLLLKPFLDAIQDAYQHIQICDECGNIDTTSPCAICTTPTRDQTILCIVENVSDLWALERSKMFKGKYHILGGVLSSTEGVGPEQLNLKKLHKRLNHVQEIILSLSATVDGQTTLHYIAHELKPYQHIKITTLAHGLPIGGELDYLDDGTLSIAFEGRHQI